MVDRVRLILFRYQKRNFNSLVMAIHRNRTC